MSVGHTVNPRRSIASNQTKHIHIITRLTAQHILIKYTFIYKGGTLIGRKEVYICLALDILRLSYRLALNEGVSDTIFGQCFDSTVRAKAHDNRVYSMRFFSSPYLKWHITSIVVGKTSQLTLIIGLAREAMHVCEILVVINTILLLLLLLL